jgi:hypothetical protein
MEVATLMAVVSMCIVGDTVMAGMFTCIEVGQAMLITDLRVATVMVPLATVIRIMGTMAGGITVTGTQGMVAGGVAAGTLMVLERAGVSDRQ